MKVELSSMPKVIGSDKRKVSPMKEEDLKGSGVAFVSYGLSEGDIVQFPENIVAVSQELTNGGKQTLVAVHRGHKSNPGKLNPSWLATGSLRRTDAERKGYNEFTVEMNDAVSFPNDLARLKHLSGKTIEVPNMVTVAVQKFEDGKPVKGETEDKELPNIVYGEVKSSTNGKGKK